MQKTVRWGILGASKFAQDFMARAIHAAEGAQLVALATSEPAKAEGFTAFCPGLKVHATYEALLADPDIDAVYIPLPNHMHLEWTLKALTAGKNVLTEKPIAMKAAEIDQIIAARDATGLLAAEAFMIVHHPQWIRARQLVQDGAIGKIQHVDAAFSYDNSAEPGNIRNRPETGGGGIRDIGVYTYGSVRFVTGAEPDDLQARMITENDVDVWAQVTGTMTGPGGKFTYSAMTSMRLFVRQEVVFQGETGLIRVTAPFNTNVFGVARLEWHSEGLTMREERWPADNHYVLQVEAFCRSVTTGVPYACSLEFVRGTQAMIDQVFAVAVPV